MIWIVRALVVLSFTMLIATTGGCALTDGRVKLEPSLAKVAPKGGRAREIIVFPAADEREDTARCGAKRNTYGMETADVHCEPAPGEWLASLVVRRLDQAGFRIVTTATSKSPDPLRLHLTVKHLFMDQVPGMLTVTLVADVHVTVAAETQSGLSAERSFFVKGENDVAAVVDSGFQAAMDQATERLADELVRAVVDLADRYPSVGAAPVAHGSRRSGALASREVLP